MVFDYSSDEWKEEREEILEKWRENGGRCARCGIIPDSPHVHHVLGTSKRIYQVLCPDCHADIHDNREIAEKRRPQFYICKFCGDRFKQWAKDENGRNIMMDLGGEPHRCSIKIKSKYNELKNSRRNHIIQILSAHEGRIMQSRLRSYIELKNEDLDHILEELAKEGRIKRAGEKIILLK